MLNLEKLRKHVEDGNVSVTEHPLDPDFKIYCYTRTQNVSDKWDDVTLMSQGLIVHKDRYVIARGFNKFFNYGQKAPYDTDYKADDRVLVRDKLDGSLGILYYGPEGFAIATKGSFSSNQALKATEILKEKYGHWIPPVDRHTYLFEIIYPGNRIVVNYGDMEDLVYLGHVDNNTGRTYFTPGHWPGPSAENFGEMTLKEALEMGARENREGIILQFSTERFLETRLLKVKQEDYVELHRIVTGLTAPMVFEHWKNESLNDLWENVPDEFAQGIKKLVEILDDEYDRVVEVVKSLAKEYTDKFDTRKDLAVAILKDYPEYGNMVLSEVYGKEDAVDRAVYTKLKKEIITPREGQL